MAHRVFLMFLLQLRIIIVPSASIVVKYAFFEIKKMSPINTKVAHKDSFLSVLSQNFYPQYVE